MSVARVARAEPQPLDQAVSQLSAHDHVCLFYDSLAEQLAASVPFVRAGLAAGERCLYIAEPATLDAVAEALADAGEDVDAWVRRGALQLTAPGETYLVGGTFIPERMVARWLAAVDAAKADGFTGVRAVGDVRFVLGHAVDPDVFVQYEAIVDQVFPAHDILALCLYDRRALPPEWLVGALAAHPLVLDQGAVRTNVHYDPVNADADAGGQAVFQRLLASLREHDLAQQRLAQADAHKQRLEAQVIQAQKMEAVGQLAAMVAHDFRNILELILSHTWVMRDEVPEDSPLRDDLDEIADTVQRGSGLVKELLRLSRRTGDTDELVDLNVLLADNAPMIERMVTADTEVQLHGSLNLRPVRAARSRLEQVVLNLVVNARDAMPTGGCLNLTTANLTLDAEAAAAVELPPGDYVCLAVADTGCGMDEAVRERLFEPFFTTKPSGQGTGLGLATVQDIVRSAGGGIAVDSAVGLGTTFRIYLPAAQVGEPAGG